MAAISNIDGTTAEDMLPDAAGPNAHKFQNYGSPQALRATLGSGGASASTLGQAQVLVGFIVAPHRR